MLIHVNLETLLIALDFPIRDGVAHAVEERAAAQIDVADQHAAQVAKVSDFVAASTESEKELNGCDDGNVRPHGDSHGEGKQPDSAVRKENCVGHENSENCA